MMAKLAGRAVAILDKAVRQFRTEVEEEAKRIAESRRDAEATPEDVKIAVQRVNAARLSFAD